MRRPYVCPLLWLTLAACAPPAHPGTLPMDPTPPALLPVAALGRDVVLEQHVTARYQDREDGFDAVLQAQGGTLSLVGIGPMGSVGFVVTVTDEGVTLQNDSGREVPFQPAHIVADVQRVFYPWIPGAPPASGERQGHALGMTIIERYVDARLVERRFVRDDAPDAGAVRVTYEGWSLGDLAPERAVLVNDWYGYALEIETSSVRDLSAP